MLVNFVSLVIFSLMLSVGLNLSVQQLLSVWRRPEALARGLLAILILFPVMTFVLLRLLSLPPAVATGFAVLAAAPGPPLLVKRSEMAGGSSAFSASLMLTLGALAVVATPLTLAVFHAFFELETERLSTVSVAGQVAMVQLLPIGLGLVLQRAVPGLAAALKKPVVVLSNILFVLMVLVALVPGVSIASQVGLVAFLVAAAMSVGGLAIGHLLGPPDQHERAAVAVGGIARNVGLAIFIVTLGGVQEQVAPTILAYMVVGFVFAMPYAVWSKRQLARS
jgi:BASS family bile acid:Na+ symporter